MALTEVKSSSGLWEAQQSGRGTPNDGSIVPGVTLLDATGAPYTASSGGGGGGPATIADGAAVTIGAVGDAAWSGSGNGTQVSILKAIWLRLRGGSANSANSFPVVIASDQAPVPVSGTFFQGTQPVSAAALPLPSGAATSAKQPALGANVAANSTPVTIASDQAAFPITEGTDAVGTGAGTQAGSTTVGVGARGWLSTITGLLQTGTAKVNQRKTTLVDDSIRSVPDQAATAALSSVPASASTGQLVAALAKSSSVTGRLGLIIVNDSASATLYIAYAATASLTAYTEKVYPGQTWEMPSPIYGGLVSGIWDAAVGNARITELS